MPKLLVLSAALLCQSLFAQDAAALWSSGQEHEQRGEHAQAIADYSQLLKLRPDWTAGYMHRGSEHFKMAHIRESVADFDKAVQLDPAQAPYNWQRGISLYYAGRYEDGRKQFDSHQTVNGNDVENAVWRYLCMARTVGVNAARAGILPIERDTRVPMMQIYALYKGMATVDDVLAAAKAGNPGPEVLNQRLFYAHLYIGLYYEAASNEKDARANIKLAVDHMVEHYMGDVARVHLELRR